MTRRESAIAPSNSLHSRRISARSMRPQSDSSSPSAPSTAASNIWSLADCCKALSGRRGRRLILHHFKLTDGFGPHLAIVDEVRQNPLHADRVLLHIGHYQLVMPELVDAEEVARNLSAD